MKLSRRLFMKAVPAAPLAAPQLVSELGAGPSGLPPPTFGFASPASSAVSENQWLIDRRDELTKRAAGEISEYETAQSDFAFDRCLAYHYDGLRSVSPVMRSRFYAQAIIKRDAKRRTLFAGLELKDIMKKMFR